MLLLRLQQQTDKFRTVMEQRLMSAGGVCRRRHRCHGDGDGHMLAAGAVRHLSGQVSNRENRGDVIDDRGLCVCVRV